MPLREGAAGGAPFAALFFLLLCVAFWFASFFPVVVCLIGVFRCSLYNLVGLAKVPQAMVRFVAAMQLLAQTPLSPRFFFEWQSPALCTAWAKAQPANISQWPSKGKFMWEKCSVFQSLLLMEDDMWSGPLSAKSLVRPMDVLKLKRVSTQYSPPLMMKNGALSH